MVDKTNETLYFLHTNDIHSHLEKWPQIKNYLLTEKQTLSEDVKTTVFTFDIGDAIDRVNPFTEATMGKGNIALMNEAHYDAVTIGNNEGIGLSHDNLDKLYQESNFTILFANLMDKKTQKIPAWAQKYQVFTTGQGNKVGVFALTSPLEATYGPLDWAVLPIKEVITEIVATLKKECQVVVLLSHLGLSADRLIAQYFPEIDLILGAHTHHLLPEGEIVGQTLLGAAGKFGEYVGKVKFEINAAGKINTRDAKVIATNDLPFATEGLNFYQETLRQGQKLLASKKITTLKQVYQHDWQHQTNLMDLLLAAINDYAQTEVAMANAGLLLTDLQAGELNAAELHACLPHPMHVLRCTLVGQELWRLMREIHKNRGFLKKFPIKGMGFRGHIFGEVCFTGIYYDDQTDIVYWQDESIDKTKFYTFATLDHWQFIPFFPTIEICGENKLFAQKLLREVLGDYLKKDKSII